MLKSRKCFKKYELLSKDKSRSGEEKHFVKNTKAFID